MNALLSSYKIDKMLSHMALSSQWNNPGSLAAYPDVHHRIFLVLSVRHAPRDPPYPADCLRRAEIERTWDQGVSVCVDRRRPPGTRRAPGATAAAPWDQRLGTWGEHVGTSAPRSTTWVNALVS